MNLPFGQESSGEVICHPTTGRNWQGPDNRFPISAPKLPTPRGDLSEHVLATLRTPAGFRALAQIDPIDEEDEAITLFVLQEISYRPFADVDPRWEEDSSFLVLRAILESRLEQRVRDHLPPTPRRGRLADSVRALLDESTGPSLSRWVADHGDLEHLRELTVHRSAYQLKEADPHSFAIPRLVQGRAKAALLEIQADEYGRHIPANSHAQLFAATMVALGLNPASGPDLDRLPASTLTTNTFLNLLGRSRRLAGACLGHLAVFEMTSVEPMARYAAAVRRCLPAGSATTGARFFDVHVAADGYHEVLAVDELLGGLEVEHPELADEALFGAAGLMIVEHDFSQHLLGAWTADQTSLRRPLPESALAGVARPPAMVRAARLHLAG